MPAPIRLYCVFLLVGLFQPVFAYPKDKSDETRYQKILDDILELQTGTECFAVENVPFERDSGKFYLKKGRIYPLSPIDGRRRAALFYGDGSFRMRPSLPIEEAELKRLTGQKEFRYDFRVLFFLFNDTTFAQITAHARPVTAKPLQHKTKDVLADVRDYLIHYDTMLDRDIAKVLLDAEENSLFYAHFYDDDRFEPYFFFVSPYDEENVSLRRWSESSTHFYRKQAEICRFPVSKPNRENGPYMRVQKYNITTEMPFHSVLSDQLDYRGQTNLTTVMLRPNQRWLYFYLNQEILVDSVLNAAGQKLDFVKDDKFSYVFVDAGRTLDKGDTLRLRFFYHSEKFLNRMIFGWISMRDESTWYPQYGSREKAYFNFTYTYPSKFELVSVGERVSRKQTDDLITASWNTPLPIANASFNIGSFKSIEIQEANLPKAVVLKTKKYGLTGRRNTEEEVLDDAINSLRFFTHLLGWPPINTLYISESPSRHGLAYPGLIRLSLLTFLFYNPGGFEELFRSHETAHQWWGIGVDYRTYRDKWLAEGFAQFFGLWYVQKALRDNTIYLKTLRQWKETLFQRETLPPVYLGTRIAEGVTPADYQWIIYNKGAWILHMLRNMLIDLQTMDEEIFVAIMRDFYNSYLGKKAGTEDFKAIVERHLKQDMDWFFDQWVYGNEMPVFEYAVHPVKWGDTGYKVYFGVHTKNVSDGFIMPVIIEIKLSNGYKARTSRWIKAPLTTFEISLPIEPEEIRFNAFESVLARTEEIDWDSFKEDFLSEQADQNTEQP